MGREVAIPELVDVVSKQLRSDDLQHQPDDGGYLDVERDDDIVFIQITLNAGRSVAVKQALYARIAELLSADPGIRKQNILVNLVQVPKENWSFGNGEAQYA